MEEGYIVVVIQEKLGIDGDVNQATTYQSKKVFTEKTLSNLTTL